MYFSERVQWYTVQAKFLTRLQRKSTEHTDTSDTRPALTIKDLDRQLREAEEDIYRQNVFAVVILILFINVYIFASVTHVLY